MKRSQIPQLPCLCASLRRASRALTQLYEEALRPLGLRGSQFTILQVLSQAGEIPQNRLGQMLAMDSTTLTRTLAIMRRQGWIGERRGQDRRERWLQLAPAGAAVLRRALPRWKRVQDRVRERVGDNAWNSMLQLSRQFTEFATREGEPQ